MKGVFMWLRRSLISFVQVTYGSTINRQIRDMVAYLHSESMLHYYLTSFIKSWWPGGELRIHDDIKEEISPNEEGNTKNNLKNDSPLSDSVVVDKVDSPEGRRLVAATLLLENIPQILINLLGQRTAKRGISKIFDILQDERANKQLFYEILELIIVELFPEIQKQRKVYTANQESV
uniref:Putative sorting nexin n=1 Tax=Xenopsylla cheopis TaxID=163159 RepID=A0A6M2DYH5_XENCH